MRSGKMSTKGVGLVLSVLLLLTQTADLVKSAKIRRSQGTGTESHPIDCMTMRSEEGLYTYISKGEETACGFYLIASPNQQIKLEFLEFNVECDTGVVGVVDGWEIQRQYFPGELDHPLPLSERNRMYCGDDRPFIPVLASQNVVLIQSLLPTSGQGYVVKVSFFENPTPCNSVSMLDSGTFTLSNFGQRSNCSVSILSPLVVETVSVDVGVSPLIPTQITGFGALLKCEKRSKEDYVELLDGTGLDPSYMYREIDFCGLDANPVNMRWLLGCSHSVVRLVSSGRYLNSVTIKHRPLTAREEHRAALLTC